ncbi:ABC transporter substrate-binding protein [Alicyclobacillus fastidiosus]|uniref:ABC transporter substrate-binding protein n=1 Tax=Alicyclobacillus fastidiosus TaxID=392011 RepID=UPI0023EA0DDE|nr:extracellular solute-binding protein [Alicyclobacillus fastidiosus]GMA61129.1 hypothetical protein GCM10025859_15690 [Alicyclobacillus fastidiosus]
MKKRANVMVTASSIVLVGGLAVGCGGATSTQANPSSPSSTGQSGSPSSSANTVNVVLEGNFQEKNTLNPVTGQTIQGLNVLQNEFTKMYPGDHVNFIVIPWTNYIAKLQTMITGGQADVYQAAGPEDQWAAQGLLVNLAPYIKKTNFNLNQYLSGQVNGWKAVGAGDSSPQIYGIPEAGDTDLIMYDKTLFDQWHVPYPSAHPTMSEIMADAKKMTGKNPVTGKQNYGVWFDAGGNSHDPMLLADLAEAQNGTWGTGNAPKNMKLNFDSTQWVNGLTWLKQLSQYAPKGIESSQGAENWLTPNNDVAIELFQGPSNIVNQADAAGWENRLGITQVFKDSKGIGGAFFGSPFVIGKSSKNKDLAWDFIQFSASDFYQDYMFKNYGVPPVTTSAWNLPDLKNNKLMQPVKEALSTMWTPVYPWETQPRFILATEIQGF